MTAVVALAACSTVAEGSGTDSVSAGGDETGTSNGSGTQASSLTDPTDVQNDSQSGSTVATLTLPGTSEGDTSDVPITTSGPINPEGTDTATDTDIDTDTELDTSTSTGSTTDPADSSTGAPDDTSTTEPGCVPTPEVCNDLDDDCNDIIDDLDVGMDGVCDCLSIALVGNQGYEPSSEFQAYLEDQGTTVERINSEVMNDINAPLTPAVLDKYDIIILDWLQRSYTPQEADAVRTWVEAGAGLMTMTGHVNNQVTIDRSNSFITPLGLKYNGSKGFFDGPVTQFAPHPITQGLTSLTFLGGLYIDVTPDMIGTNTTIMTLQQGPVGVVQERVKGRVFVFGDEWVEFDSQWQNMPEIKQFWVQTLAYLGPKDSCIVPQ